jgi:syntaxin 5
LLVAKKKSLFQDSTTEINQLTYIIKNDLQTLHHELEVLYDWVQTSSSTVKQSTHSARNSDAIVQNLKLQLVTTTKSFQDILHIRTNNLKEANTRRKAFEGNNNSIILRKRNNHNMFSELMEEKNDSIEVVIDSEPSQPDDQMHAMSLMEPVTTDDYLSTRAQAVESIESTIVELGDMYKRLVTIVGMQEEVTLRIDANMDNTLEHMDAGHRELLKYFDRISNNRWLILKIFAVLIVFLVFFMLFIA